MLCLILSVSTAASRICGATWVFGDSVYFSAPARDEIAEAAVMRTSPVIKNVRMEEIYTIGERGRYRNFFKNAVVSDGAEYARLARPSGTIAAIDRRGDDGFSSLQRNS
jgi:hypothetical protein